MIYHVFLDGTSIYDTVPGRQVISGQASLELNGAGSCDITIPYNHEAYNLPQPMKSVIDITEDDNIVWFGRVTDISTNWNNEKKISAEGALAYFNDSILRPRTWTNEYIRTFFSDIIDMHNDLVGLDKQFTVGTVDVDNVQVTRTVDYTKTFDVLQEQCIKAVGGYILLRKEKQLDGSYIQYIDWLREIQEVSSQSVEFGINLLDINSNFITSDIITAVIPLGDDGNGNKVTIKNTQYDPPAGYTIYDDYIQNDDAVDQYGLITEVVEFNDTSNKILLADQGYQYLKKKQFDHLSFECNVAELKYLDADKQAFNIGQNVRVYSVPHNILDTTMVISKISYDISKANKKITIGTPPKQDLSEITGTSRSGSSDGSTVISGGGGSSGGGGGSTVSVEPIILTGDSIATITVNGDEYTLKYDASTKADADSVYTKIETDQQISGYVVPNPSDTPSSSLSKLQIGETIYDIPGGSGGDSVSYEPILTDGVLIGNLIINSVPNAIFAPEGGGGSEGDGQMIVPYTEINKVPILLSHDYSIEQMAYTPVDVILTPVMTSATAPSGTVTYSSQANGYDAYKAFNGASKTKNGWIPTTSDTTPYIAYTFTSEKTFSKVIIETYGESQYSTRDITIEGLNSNNEWVNCLSTGNTASIEFYVGEYTDYEIDLDGNQYTALRITGAEAWNGSGFACYICEIQIKYVSS